MFLVPRVEMTAEDRIVASADLLQIGKNMIPSFPDLLEIHQIVPWIDTWNESQIKVFVDHGFSCVCARICKSMQKNIKRGYGDQHFHTHYQTLSQKIPTCFTALYQRIVKTSF